MQLQFTVPRWAPGGAGKYRIYVTLYATDVNRLSADGRFTQDEWRPNTGTYLSESLNLSSVTGWDDDEARVPCVVWLSEWLTNGRTDWLAGYLPVQDPILQIHKKGYDTVTNTIDGSEPT